MRLVLLTVLGFGLLGGAMGAAAAPKAKRPKGNASPPASACKGDRDVDGDGHESIACGGDDCDDGRADRYPGNAEICDTTNVDEDCDPTTFGRRDQDDDGVIDARCCNGNNCGDDCDDMQSSVHPTATETCNQRDDDCDGVTDEDLLVTSWRDADRDLYGSAQHSSRTCPHLVPKGNVNNDYDCDDGNVAKNPRGGC